MICDMDCFNCKFSDCINDMIEPEDIKTSRERDLKADEMLSDDYKKRWYQKNKEKVKERKHQWYLANKEKSLARHKKYYAEHREEILKRECERYQRNKEYMNHQNAIRRKIRWHENPEYYRAKQREARRRARERQAG